MSAIVRGEWPASGVTFRTSRGSFEIPADVLERAELTDDDFEIRRAFAMHLPGGARPYRREKLPGGAVRVHWRRILLVEL
jgi:hypothetical protein